MNAKEFKAQSEILMDTLLIDFFTKKELLNWLEFTGKEMDFLRDEDNHVYAYVGKDLYSDDEITPAILRSADYIEVGHADGYMFYIGRNVDGEALQDAFDSSIGWHIDAGLEFGELAEGETGKIIRVV